MIAQEITDTLTANLKFYRDMLLNSDKVESMDSTGINHLKDLLRNEIQVIEDIFEFRIKRVNEMENPYLPPVVHTEYYFIDRDPMRLSVNELINHFLDIKELVLKYILLIHPSRLSRTGYHWQEGHITLEQLIQRYYRNDQKFAEQLQMFLSL